MQDLKDIKAILWDVDDTLIRTGQYHVEKFNVVAARFGIDYRIEEAEHAVSPYKGRKGQFTLLKEKYGLPITADKFNAACEVAYLDLLKSETQSLRPEVVGLYEAAKNKNIVQAAVSNGSYAPVISSLQCAGLLEDLSFVLTEEDVQYRKPDIEPFLLAQHFLKDAFVQANLPPIQYPSEILFVDDCPQNIKTALKLGMRTRHI